MITIINFIIMHMDGMATDDEMAGFLWTLPFSLFADFALLVIVIVAAVIIGTTVFIPLYARKFKKDEEKNLKSISIDDNVD